MMWIMGRAPSSMKCKHLLYKNWPNRRSGGISERSALCILSIYAIFLTQIMSTVGLFICLSTTLVTSTWRRRIRMVNCSIPLLIITLDYFFWQVIFHKGDAIMSFKSTKAIHGWGRDMPTRNFKLFDKYLLRRFGSKYRCVLHFKFPTSSSSRNNSLFYQFAAAPS